MALFNKLFPSRKNNSSNQDSISEKPFAFTKDQVRVILFRECDFRGRKLLFDSMAIKRIKISSTLDKDKCVGGNEEKDFAEITDGYGYMYIKPPTDVNQLSEMIFGLVAMSYRGSYFKVHNLESPSRFMFTQVFPSPKFFERRKSSTSSSYRTSNQSLEHSIRLEDSGASISDHSSVYSTASDTLLVCRHSNPLDVPQKLSGSSTSVICDSGVYAERSCSSFEKVGHCNMIPFWESKAVKGSTISFSNSTLYKRWLRSTSVEQSSHSTSTGSMDEIFSKHHQRSSRLGLAFILHLTPEQEQVQIQFLMEHIALLDSMLRRARQATEIAYLRPHNFLSILLKMVDLSSTWLTNFLSGPLLPLNLWTSIYSSCSDQSADINSFGCDNNNSINKCSDKCDRDTTDIFRTFLNASNVGLFNSHNCSAETVQPYNMLSRNQCEKSDFSFSNITKIIKNEWDLLNSRVFGRCTRNNLEEKFIEEFCELLETIDVKDTNFFMSTLLTAVLTHHLGWVATCLPPDGEHQPLVDIPFNPFWDQLSDLYGAVGHPTKIAQTIILGNKKKDLVTKIISCLTYFIRCVDLERNNVIRCNINDDNKTADYICHKNSCIPKENYKKYKDHLREMWRANDCISESTNVARNKVEVCESVPNKRLSRMKKSYFDFTEFQSDDSKPNNSNWTNLKELNNLMENKTENHSEIDRSATNTSDNVVFVLGDDEKLVNIKKKENSQKKINFETNKVDKGTDSARELSVPNFLDSIFKKYETFEQEFSKSIFRDDDFVKCTTETSIKPSTSWASLQQAEEKSGEKKMEKFTVAACSRDNKAFVRSRSEPPESDSKELKEEIKAKYRYSGVKFSLHQYPQVVTNYMRSKNLEMSNLTFSEITKKFDEISSQNDEINSQYGDNSDEMEALQTPSNASELEFTSDLNVPRKSHARESSEKPLFNMNKEILNQKPSQDYSSLNGNDSELDSVPKMKIIHFPMPESERIPVKSECIPYQMSLLRGLNDDYIPDLVLQGISAPKKDWESSLRNELALTSHHGLLDQAVEEAVAIIADTDTWEVQLVSSHTYVIDKTSSGVKVGMSQLIANMLDSLLKMWKLQVPPQFCLLHIEQRLQALCVRSKALAQLLLATEFCSMEFLTSTLHLEVNDVPLLLAVASTYSPQVTQKYGISFT